MSNNIGHNSARTVQTITIGAIPLTNSLSGILESVVYVQNREPTSGLSPAAAADLRAVPRSNTSFLRRVSTRVMQGVRYIGRQLDRYDQWNHNYSNGLSRQMVRSRLEPEEEVDGETRQHRLQELAEAFSSSYTTLSPPLGPPPEYVDERPPPYPESDESPPPYEPSELLTRRDSVRETFL